MNKLWLNIDFEALYIIMFCALTIIFSWWGLLVVGLLPQGRILGRAFGDVRIFERRLWPYLIANETVLLAIITLLAGARLAVMDLAGKT